MCYQGIPLGTRTEGTQTQHSLHEEVLQMCYQVLLGREGVVPGCDSGEAVD